MEGEVAGLLVDLLVDPVALSVAGLLWE